MLRHMRTTIIIDDAVLRQAKKLAREQETTLSGLIEDALKDALSRAAAPRKKRPFKLVVNKGPGLRSGLSWATAAAQVLSSDPNGLP